MTTEGDSPVSSPLAGYPMRSYDKLRYSDTDRQGHVNNAVFSTFFETGRVELMHQLRQVAADPTRDFVLAKISIEFLKELLWPGDVEVGSRVVRVGNSSIVVEQLLTSDGIEHARAESVMVLTDTTTRRSTPLDEMSLKTLDTLTG